MLVAGAALPPPVVGPKSAGKFSHHSRKNSFISSATHFPAFLPKEMEYIRDPFARKLASRIERVPVDVKPCWSFLFFIQFGFNLLGFRCWRLFPYCFCCVQLDLYTGIELHCMLNLLLPFVRKRMSDFSYFSLKKWRVLTMRPSVHAEISMFRGRISLLLVFVGWNECWNFSANFCYSLSFCFIWRNFECVGTNGFYGINIHSCMYRRYICASSSCEILMDIRQHIWKCRISVAFA